MNIQQIFPRKWLYPEDLNGRAVTVVIEAAAIEDLRNPRTNKMEPKLVVSFQKATKRLIVNKTQAYAIATATGSQDTDKWAGCKVTLSAAMAPNGKATIHAAPVADPHTDAGADGAGADHSAGTDTGAGEVGHG